MPSSSRIIPGEHLSEAVPFALGALKAGHGGGTRSGRGGLRNDDAAIDPLRQSFELGFRRGLAEGTARMERAIEAERAALGMALADRVESLLANAEAELETFREQAAERVVGLALDIARQVLRVSVATDPAAIVAVVQEALAAMLDSQARTTLLVHPNDEAAVADALAPVLARRNIAIQADRSIAAGGCRLVSAEASVDATVATRWQRVVDAIGRPDAPPPTEP